jgi:hypothetical protein
LPSAVWLFQAIEIKGLVREALLARRHILFRFDGQLDSVTAGDIAEQY